MKGRGGGTTQLKIALREDGYNSSLKKWRGLKHCLYPCFFPYFIEILDKINILLNLKKMNFRGTQ